LREIQNDFLVTSIPLLVCKMKVLDTQPLWTPGTRERDLAREGENEKRG
jgi:hypothetical protein